MRYAQAALAVLAITTGIVIGALFQGERTKVVTRQKVETIFIVNRSQGSITDGAIRADIPAWQAAANHDFAPAWGTPQVRLRLVKKVPRGGIEALFVKNGPIQGALAYHTVTNGVPEIVVYAGVGKFYGYSNSVSFTHELFEMLADPTLSQINQGYPFPFVTLLFASTSAFPNDGYFIQEVCDPVEAASYRVRGVMISDFILPNWFNDQVMGGFDFMNVLGQPYEIARGGYAQYEVNGVFFPIVNFRHAGKDASGFLKGEKLARP